MSDEAGAAVALPRPQGERVRLKDVTGYPYANGKCGIVAGQYDAEQGRQCVQLETGHAIMVRLECMEDLEQDQDQEQDIDALQQRAHAAAMQLTAPTQPPTHTMDRYPALPMDHTLLSSDEAIQEREERGRILPQAPAPDGEEEAAVSPEATDTVEAAVSAKVTDTTAASVEAAPARGTSSVGDEVRFTGSKSGTTLGAAQVVPHNETTVEFLLFSFKSYCIDLYNSSRPESWADKMQPLLKKSKVLKDIDWGDECTMEAATDLCIDGLEVRVKAQIALEKKLKEDAYKELRHIPQDPDIHPMEIEARVGRVHALLNIPQEETSCYYTFVRIKNGYLFFVTTALGFSIFSGILTEMLVGAFTKTFENKRWCIIFMPFLVMFFSCLVEHMYHLALDAIDTPPFTRFQATMLAFFSPNPTKAPSLKACQIVDFGMICYECWPLMVGMYGIVKHANDPDGRGPVGAFLNSYVWGGIAACNAMATFYLIAQLYLHMGVYQQLPTAPDEFRSSTESLTGDGPEAIKVYQKALDKQEIFPVNPFVNWIRGGLPWHRSGISRLQGCCFKKFLVEKDITSYYDVRMAALKKSTPGEKKAVLASIATWCILCFLLTIDISGMNDFFNVLVVAGLAWVVVLCSSMFIRKFPDISGAGCLGILAAYSIVFCALLYLAGSQVAMLAGKVDPTMLMQWNVNVSEIDATMLPPFVPIPNDFSDYTVCSRTWGSPNAPVHALDLGQLSSIVYDPSIYHYWRMEVLLNQTFNEPDKPPRVILDEVTGYNEFPRYAVFHFPSSKAGETGSRVIAVKGTSTKEDAFADIVLFSAVRVLQQFQVYVPVLSVLPVSQVQWMLEKFHMPGQLDTEKKIFDKLISVVNKYAKKNDKLVLTGHSLGGGLVQVVASKTKHSALTWSAPGIEFSTLRFGISNSERTWPGVQAAKRSVTNIIPSNDKVPLVDRQLGIVQDIECRDKDGKQARSGTATCHGMQKSLCEIWRVCGDVYNRSFSTACSKFVARKSLNKYYPTDDVTASSEDL